MPPQHRSGAGGYDDDQRPSSIKGSSSLMGGNDQRGYGGHDYQGGGVGTSYSSSSLIWSLKCHFFHLKVKVFNLKLL